MEIVKYDVKFAEYQNTERKWALIKCIFIKI